MRGTSLTALATTALSLLATWPALAAPPAQLAGYEKGKGFTLRDADGDFALHLQSHLQFRFVLEALDEGGDETGWEGAFLVPRARLKLSGHAFSKDLAFELQSDFGRGFVTLKDAWLQYDLGDRVFLRAGQFKRPYSRQQLTSGSRQELVDRAITNGLFPAGRDLGLMLHDGFDKSPTFEWAAGLFNGTGDRTRFSGSGVLDPETDRVDIGSGGFSNVPDLLDPALVARVGYNHGDVKGYSEGDLEGGPLRFGVGLSGHASLDADGDDDSLVSAELDWILKASGFSTTGGLYLTSAQDGEGFGDRALDAYGLHVQASYVVADRYQPVLRFAHVARDGGDDTYDEALAGLSVYFAGHAVKWQSEVGLSHRDEIDGDAITQRTDFAFRTQVQLNF